MKNPRIARIFMDYTGSGELKSVLIQVIRGPSLVILKGNNYKTMIDTVHAERRRIFPGSAQCEDFDPQKIWNAADDIRSLRACPNCGFLRSIDHKKPDFRALKSLILFGIRGMAAYACHVFFNHI